MDAKPKVNIQGKVIAEKDGRNWLVLLPDGTVETAASKRAVEKLAREYAEGSADPQAVNTLLIEWRS